MKTLKILLVIFVSCVVSNTLIAQNNFDANSYRQFLLDNQDLETNKVINVKNQMIKIIQEQPEDSTFDEILRELAFKQMIERGLADSDNQRTISNQEMRRRILSW